MTLCQSASLQTRRLGFDSRSGHVGPLVRDGDDLGQVSSYYIIKMALTTAGLLPDCSRAVE